MNFSMLPPEFNADSIFAGAGSAPMPESAASWDGLAGELASAANSFSSATSGLAGAPWKCQASQAMTDAANAAVFNFSMNLPARLLCA